MATEKTKRVIEEDNRFVAGKMRVYNPEPVQVPAVTNKEVIDFLTPKRGVDKDKK